MDRWSFRLPVPRSHIRHSLAGPLRGPGPGLGTIHKTLPFHTTFSRHRQHMRPLRYFRKQISFYPESFFVDINNAGRIARLHGQAPKRPLAHATRHLFDLIPFQMDNRLGRGRSPADWSPKTDRLNGIEFNQRLDQGRSRCAKP